MAGQSAPLFHPLDGEPELPEIRDLEAMSSQSRIRWALDRLPGHHVLSSSFGIQSAVLLHMVTAIQPDIKVILVDTGYLFDETYRFVDQLTERLKLNLVVYRPVVSPREQEKRYGQLWKQGKQGLEQYNRINKVEPMNRALRESGARTWIAGLRRQQGSTRANLAPIQLQDGRYKLLPVIDWTNQDIHQYLRKHNLPYHPLWEKGYVSVGDTHTTRPLEPGMTEEQTRFFGIQRECGLHTQPGSAAATDGDLPVQSGYQSISPAATRRSSAARIL